MNSDERMKNYHWSESNISDWAKDKIIEELVKREYSIVNLDIFVKICSRMNSLGLIYIINLDTIKDNKSCILTNFTTTHKENEGLDDYPWFIDFFKELEGQALLLFSKNVLDLEDKERASVDVPKIKANVKTFGTFTYSSLVNCKPDEYQKFLLSPEFMQMWSREMRHEDDIVIGRIRYKVIKEEEGLIILKFRLEDWVSYTNVEIKLSDIRGSTKISLKQEDVPLKDLDVMKGMWRENIFMPICMTFGLIERDY